MAVVIKTNIVCIVSIINNYRFVLLRKVKPYLECVKIVKFNYYLKALSPVTSMPVINRWISCVPS